MNPLTQDFLEFDQIQEGVLILKNKGLRAILMVSSLNFYLKSSDEQNAIIFQFQNFLNSLDFSCQILIQSRRLNITGYIEKLQKLGEKEPDELLQLQISEYCKFIEQIMEGGSIMQKTFYVIIPFSLSEVQSFDTKKGLNATIPSLTEEQFQRAKNQLFQRAEFVVLGLKSCGLDSIPLTSVEITELLWSLHHQNEAEKGYFPEIPPELIK